MIQKNDVDIEGLLDKYLPYVKKWWFSVACIPFCWVLMEQYWMALKYEISFSWMYDYPFFLAPFFFMIDNFLLIVHEAGHTFFRVFGNRFLTILGGTLLEILLPFGIFVFGWVKGKRYTAQLGLLLTGFAWVESSAYAFDAYEKRMPLIGNLPKSAHDFGNMLSDLNLLNHHDTVAWAMYWIGVLTLILFFIWPFLERKKTEYVDIEMDL